VQVQLATGGVLTNATGISAGTSYTCAVANSKALCWGNNGYGQLGDNTVVDKLKAIINGL
jgi:alpha-tubulin suppressor-like RCC1 family protein